MKWLFNQTINKDSWEKIFQSIDAFHPLAKAIFLKHGLEFTGIENLTPGTNAVFRSGDTVIKIFAPIESGFYNNDFEIEVESLKHANDVGVHSPKLLFQGYVEDRYIFRYMIMEFLQGQEAGHELKSMLPKQKEAFVHQLKNIMERLNIQITSKAIPTVTAQSCFENQSWGCYPESFCVDRKKWIENLSFNDYVYTHGDITPENMIIGDDGKVYIIDFADSRIAPFYYEWPPIIFGIFEFNKSMMTIYFGDYHNDVFYDQLTSSVLIHEFGADMIKTLCEWFDVPMQSLIDVHHLKDFLVKCLEIGKR